MVHPSGQVTVQLGSSKTVQDWSAGTNARVILDGEGWARIRFMTWDGEPIPRIGLYSHWSTMLAKNPDAEPPLVRTTDNGWLTLPTRSGRWFVWTRAAGEQALSIAEGQMNVRLGKEATASSLTIRCSTEDRVAATILLTEKGTQEGWKPIQYRFGMKPGENEIVVPRVQHATYDYEVRTDGGCLAIGEISVRPHEGAKILIP